MSRNYRVILGICCLDKAELVFVYGAKESLVAGSGNLCWAGKFWMVDLILPFLWEPSIETLVSFGLLTQGLVWMTPFGG